MKIVIENPTREFLQNGKEYLAKFEGPRATRKELMVRLYPEGFSALNDGEKRFLWPIDPLFWLNEGESEIILECEAIQKS